MLEMAVQFAILTNSRFFYFLIKDAYFEGNAVRSVPKILNHLPVSFLSFIKKIIRPFRYIYCVVTQNAARTSHENIHITFLPSKIILYSNDNSLSSIFASY